jgi:hypothetical protein
MTLDELKRRANLCITHHHACDCREYAHAQALQQAEARIKELEETTAALSAILGAIETAFSKDGRYRELMKAIRPVITNTPDAGCNAREGTPNEQHEQEHPETEIQAYNASSEWRDLSTTYGPLWSHKTILGRFSRDGGKTWYDLEEKGTK